MKPLKGRHIQIVIMGNLPMRHLIERVWNSPKRNNVWSSTKNRLARLDEELKALLESLQPRIRVYGVGGAGCNAINRLFDEKLFDSSYVTGYAINTDAQALLQSPIEEKVSSAAPLVVEALVATPPKEKQQHWNPNVCCAASPTTPNWRSSRLVWAVGQAPAQPVMWPVWPRPKAP